MELSTLRAFVSVAQTGSFSEAAQQLYITQPAMSKRVSSLEKELQCKLFDRIGRHIQLTPVGTHLLDKARQLLNDADDIKRLAFNFSAEISGNLLVGTSHHIGLHRLPPVIQQFTERYPQVKLDLRFLDSETACRQVEAGELEIAIVTLPENDATPLELTVIWHDELALMVNQAHPLAKQAKTSLKELVSYPAVLPGPSTYTRHILDQALAQRHLQPKVAMSTNYLETLKMLVATGQGWSLLPAQMRDRNLVILDTPLQLARSLGIVIHRERTLSNATEALIQTLRDNQAL